VWSFKNWGGKGASPIGGLLERGIYKRSHFPVKIVVTERGEGCTRSQDRGIRKKNLLFAEKDGTP